MQIGRQPQPYHSEHVPHGLYINAPHRIAFVACEGNARLLIVDLTFDPGLGRLYVASESGTVTVFQQRGKALESIGEYRAPAAHSVTVDPVSHRVYLPFNNVNGQPVLRILTPIERPASDR